MENIKTKTKIKRPKFYRTHGGKLTKRQKRFKVRLYLVLAVCLLAGYTYFLSQMNQAKGEHLRALEANLEATKTVNGILQSKLNVEIHKMNVLEVLEGTPMEEAIPHIKKAADHYEIPVEAMVGIAFAESSFKSFKCFNPWGIGDGGPRCYQSWEHAANGAAQLLRYYYFNEGKDTPEELLLKYVGWNNPYWVDNVRTYWNP